MMTLGQLSSLVTEWLGTVNFDKYAGRLVEVAYDAADTGTSAARLIAAIPAPSTAAVPSRPEKSGSCEKGC